jgi:hypothetical protein
MVHDMVQGQGVSGSFASSLAKNYPSWTSFLQDRIQNTLFYQVKHFIKTEGLVLFLKIL